MKVCPKCEAVNKDSQRLCVNCDAYLGNVVSAPEENYAEKIIAKSNRKRKARSIIFTALFLLVYSGWIGFTMNICVETFGNLSRYYYYLLLYIPCLILFFFPYNKVYCWYRRKKELAESYLSDHVIAIFKALAWIYLLCLAVGTYDMLNVKM